MLARPDLDAEVLSHERSQPVELFREDRRRSVGRLRVVRVAAARVRHRGQELLVEPVAEADRRGTDALGARAPRQLDELARVGDPDVRQAVGQEEDPSAAAQLLEPPEPASGEVRRPARPDVRECGAERGGVHGRERRQQPNRVVVVHERELVVRAQARDEPGRAALRDLELRAGHRAGAVEHEREPQRRALPGRRCLRHRELEQRVNVVLAVDGEKGVVRRASRLPYAACVRSWSHAQAHVAVPRSAATR